MRSIAKGWSPLSLAAGGVVVGFVIAACSVGLGNLGTGGPDALPPAAPTALADLPPRGELTPEEQRRIAVIEEASPSVVFISTSAYRRDFFSTNIFKIPQGNGTGFVWDKNGHIVTNFHVIRGVLTRRHTVEVTFSDDKTYPAEVRGYYADKDIAVLKISAPSASLHPIQVGDSKGLRVGQSALAIGNPFGFDNTVTTGVISALGREIDSVVNTKIIDVIQTDAAINPGNSGGPLLDSHGRVIGVNTQIISPSHASAGIGFAIPIHIVKKVVPQLIEHGIMVKPIHPVLGIEVDGAKARRYEDFVGFQPIIIGKVLAGSGAARAGLKVGDIIVKIDERRVMRLDDLRYVLEKHDPGDTIEVTYIRDDKERETKLKLMTDE